MRKFVLKYAQLKKQYAERMCQMRHLLNPLDFTVEETAKLLDLASDIEKNPAKYSEKCKGKKNANIV